MSDITVINDSEQSSLVTNGLAKDGELYLKAAGSTDAGAIIVYDSGAWRTFANEYSSGFSNSYSVDLDATNDYVNLGNLGTAGRSLGCLSLWVKTDNAIRSGSTSYRGGLAGWGGGFNGLLHGYMSTADKILTVENGGRRSYWSGASGYQLSTGWHNIVMNHNGTGYDIYVDGDIAGTSTGTLTVNSFSKLTGTAINGFYINTAGSNSFHTGGLYDEVSLWDDGLTATQISDIYNNGTPVDLSSYSPDGWWRMGDGTESGSGTTVYDLSGNSNNGTLVNGPTFSSDVPS
jgi:hypothetical protein